MRMIRNTRASYGISRKPAQHHAIVWVFRDRFAVSLFATETPVVPAAQAAHIVRHTEQRLTRKRRRVANVLPVAYCRIASFSCFVVDATVKHFIAAGFLAGWFIDYSMQHESMS